MAFACNDSGMLFFLRLPFLREEIAQLIENAKYWSVPFKMNGAAILRPLSVLCRNYVFKRKTKCLKSNCQKRATS